MVRGGVAALLAVVLMAGCATTMGGTDAHSFPVTLPRPATLGGTLYTPGGPGPFPAVIVVHGCSGTRLNHHVWAHWLQAEGYAAFVIDSFAGRGIRSLCGDSRPLFPGPRSNDVFEAARYLKSLPRIDGGRIAAMGYSHGGSTVLWAGAYAGRYPDTPLKALVAFYPGCGNYPIYRGATPMLMLLGAKDDWTPAEPCRILAQVSRSEGAPVEAVLYPEARHGFDAAQTQGIAYIAEALGGRGATAAYDARAHGDAEKQVRRFLAEHLKR